MAARSRLMWTTEYRSLLKNKRNGHEDRLLLRLQEVIPEGIEVTIVADRSFGDHKLYAFLDELALEYVIRFRGDILVTDEKGETIPDDLVAAMRRARGFGKGLWVRHQLFYASVSLNFYDSDPSSLDTTARLKELQALYSPFDYVDDTFFQTSFGHLDGYSAIYYTYMWSLVIAKDLFSVFERDGITNPEVAARYRKLILGPGGSRDAAVMVRDFLGRDYDFEAFAAWLNSEE